MSHSDTLPRLAALALAAGAALALRADGSAGLPVWGVPLLQLPAVWLFARHGLAARGTRAIPLDVWLLVIVTLGGLAGAVVRGRLDLLLLGPTLYLSVDVCLRHLARLIERLGAAAGRPRAAFAALLPTWGWVIVLATILLALPIATRSGVPDYRHHFWSHVLNCAVTSVGAACLSGQSIYSLGGDFTRFGQIVVLLETLVAGMCWTAMGLALVQPLLPRTIRLATVLKAAFAAVCVGAALLYPVWRQADASSPAARIGWSLMHATGAMFNAGWTMKPSGLAGELRHPLAFVTMTTLALLGSVGVPVVIALLRRPASSSDSAWKPKSADVSRAGGDHPAIAPAWPFWESAVAGGALMLMAVVLFLSETPRFLPAQFVPSRPVEFHGALPSLRDQMSHGERWSYSVFAAAVRSAGVQSFTVAEGGLSWPGGVTILASCLLGGSIGGVAGGFRLSVFALPMALFLSRRRAADLDAPTRRRFVVRVALIPLVTLALTALAILAVRAACDGTWYEIVFDTTAACGNVGLTTGLGLHLPWPGRLLLIGCIIAGRLVPVYLWARAISSLARLDDRAVA